MGDAFENEPIFPAFGAFDGDHAMSPRRASFRFETSRHGGATVLRLCDSHYHADSLEPLDAKLREAEAETAAGLVIVDLGAVALLSSTALRAFRASHRRLEETGGRIVAAGGGELVADVLKFAPFINHYPTIDEAVSALSATGNQ